MMIHFAPRFLATIFNRRCPAPGSDFRVLPPLSEYRSLLRRDTESFVTDEPVYEESLDFDPPDDCREQRWKAAFPAPTPGERLLRVEEASCDPLELGELPTDAQGFLVGLLDYFSIELPALLDRVAYDPARSLPEGPDGPELARRIAAARIGGLDKERLLVAARILPVYLEVEAGRRFALALSRLLAAMEWSHTAPEGERLAPIDQENVRRLVAAVERAPNRYWQLLSIVKSLRNVTGVLLRRMGVASA